MGSRRSAVLPILLFAAACAEKPAVPPTAPAPVQTTASAQPAPRTPRAEVGLSDDITRACNIQFDNVDRAPKFDFAETALLPEDRSVLEQVARCVTTGPLKGRAIRLVGRADPRGEVEYNMTLGEHRADTVRRYLASLGVDDRRISETSRGKLDAVGSDDVGWRRDRRVDIGLQ
jgi:peptidoglycan-associated lipoprotein